MTPHFGRGAAIFLLDQTYLLPFQVMMHSMRDAVENRNVDIVVLTDDDGLLDNPFLRRICDKIIKISEDQLELLKSIDLSSVPDEFRHPKYGVYWFLKFLVFDYYGYDYHIYLDTDMLALRRDFSFDDIFAGTAFSAAPTIGKTALGIPPNSRGSSNNDLEQQRIVDTTREIAARNYKISRSINSGVMSIPKSMIGRSTVRSLVELSTLNSYRLEQDVVRAHASQFLPDDFRPLPIWLNMPELPLRAAGEVNAIERLLPYTKILHFNLHPKPWKISGRPGWVHQIWHRHRSLATRWIETQSTPPH
ncbi:lipopolysaccharide biosynthesis glycosyltransferase [Rhizobium soli]|uniref:Lipopolysaccharide biosynthesis glycosyltransferase n=1 Tax=Rhizobium soli TaxID=424798 RepID=A0A7X0MTJ3_9HYPH|nr:hypothetical protein [Rhizobium soli]MBB6511097.1 lipopolysaccharide biosynthesis glycosyltransferase [Rhizobium soli]